MTNKQRMIANIEADLQILRDLPEDYYFILVNGGFGAANDFVATREKSRDDVVGMLESLQRTVRDYDKKDQEDYFVTVIKDNQIFCFYQTQSLQQTELEDMELELKDLIEKKERVPGHLADGIAMEIESLQEQIYELKIEEERNQL